MSDESGTRRGSAQNQLSERERFAHGLPGYHDPLAGFGGPPPTLNALTLRLVLAIFALAVCAVGTVLLAVAGAPVGFTVVVAVLAVIAVIDIAVIVRRKRRCEPG
jgi:Flp pilus assembly protein TadB